MGWKITSVRLSDEDYAKLQAEKIATKKPIGTILVEAWKRGKGAGEADSSMVAHSEVSQPPSAQTTGGCP